MTIFENNSCLFYDDSDGTIAIRHSDLENPVEQSDDLLMGIWLRNIKSAFDGKGCVVDSGTIPAYHEVIKVVAGAPPPLTRGNMPGYYESVNVAGGTKTDLPGRKSLIEYFDDCLVFDETNPTLYDRANDRLGNNRGDMLNAIYTSGNEVLLVTEKTGFDMVGVNERCLPFDYRYINKTPKALYYALSALYRYIGDGDLHVFIYDPSPNKKGKGARPKSKTESSGMVLNDEKGAEQLMEAIKKLNGCYATTPKTPNKKG